MATGTSIFLAGGEVEALTKDLLENGVKNILYSYFYILTMKREAAIERWMNAYPHVNFFLDSGAFTYGMKHKVEPEKLPPLKQYLERYFAYIEEHGWRYCRITEPDMDIAGESPERVKLWREEMLNSWPHLNVTPVWHTHRGQDEWYRYVMDKRVKTLALGSGDFKDVGHARKQILLAQQYGKPVHGFGMTRINTKLRQLPVDSADSTSWVMGQKSGTLYVFQNNTFKVFPKEYKAKRRLYRTYFRNIGCDPQKVIDDDVHEVRKANIIAWRVLSERLEYIKRRQRQTHGVDNNVFAAKQASVFYGRERPPVAPLDRGPPAVIVREERSPANSPKARKADHRYAVPRQRGEAAYEEHGGEGEASIDFDEEG